MGTKPYDLIIVGGGITGAGIARDATLRGLKVALFEKGDYGSGTSSKSSKMIHGGIRYLEHGALGMVFESVRERAVQRRVAPHLVRGIRFLIPFYERKFPGLELTNVGLWIYDAMAMFRAPKMHKAYRGAKARKLEPILRNDELRGALEFSDCITDDSRLVLENILDAKAQGADCHSYTEVIRLERDDKGRVCAVVARDLVSGTETTYPTRSLIVAAGPWTDSFLHGTGDPKARRLLRRTKGVHLVFPRDKLPLERAIGMYSPTDQRRVFASPWRGRTIVGTTDTDYEGDADDAHADKDDAAYLCDAANAAFPTVKLTPADAIATFSGLRPLVYEEGVEDESDVSREHEIHVRDDGLIIIAGGKLTTYRRMAEEVVDRNVKWLERHDGGFDAKLRKSSTRSRRLPGAVGLDNPTPAGVRELGKRLASKYALDADIAQHLAEVYGMRAFRVGTLIEADATLGTRMNSDLPYIWAEIPFAASDDLAHSLSDVLSRRVPLLLLGRDQGLDVAERAADMLAEVLGWNPALRARNLADYRRVVGNSRRFRSGDEPATGHSSTAS